MSDAASLSVVVPVMGENAAIAETYRDYQSVFAAMDHAVQMIFVLDGRLPQTLEVLRSLKAAGESIDLFSFEQPQGEAAALSVGFQHATGDVVLTLGAAHEIVVEDITKVLKALDGSDMAVASRMMPSKAGDAVQAGKLERALHFLLGSSFRDIRCGVRAMKSNVAKELTIYGNQQRFLPLIAQTQGFSVQEVDVRPSRELLQSRAAMTPDVSLMLDVVTIYFLIKFTKKPFRFFGGFGFGVLIFGVLATAYLVLARLFFDVPLVDRPALILSSLMIVLGIQILSVGLIGEIIAFSYAKDVKDYKVDRIVE